CDYHRATESAEATQRKKKHFLICYPKLQYMVRAD
ncbi:MAG: hypothetical protein ACI8WB_003459, partial [Phenylobacterium sp.]